MISGHREPSDPLHGVGEPPPAPAASDGAPAAIESDAGAPAGQPSSAAAPDTGGSWLGKAIVDGLVHCACSHQSVHPDLLTLVTGEIESIAPHGPGSHGVLEEDAG